MRIRTIKPDFWHSEKIAKLSKDDRLLFIGLWNVADDAGVIEDKYQLIAAELFPFDLEADPRATYASVRGGLDALTDIRLLTRYEVDGKGYLFIPGWEEHQRIDRPSKSRLPQPTTQNAPIQGVLIEDSSNTLRVLDVGKGKGSGKGKGKGIGNGTDAAQLLDDFATWYATYPKHVARPAAIKAYSKARENATADALLDGARRYNAEVVAAATKAQFIKHPATWLNNEGWLDEPAVAVMADRKPEWD
jgi:hypothetical protein